MVYDTNFSTVTAKSADNTIIYKQKPGILLQLYSLQHISWMSQSLHTYTHGHPSRSIGIFHLNVKQFKFSLIISTIYCIYICNTNVDQEYLTMHNRASVRQLCSPILCGTNTAIMII